MQVEAPIVVQGEENGKRRGRKLWRRSKRDKRGVRGKAEDPSRPAQRSDKRKTWIGKGAAHACQGMRRLLNRLADGVPRGVKEFVRGDPEVGPFVKKYRGKMVLAGALLVMVGLGRLLASRLGGSLVDAAVAQSVPGIALFAGGVLVSSLIVAGVDMMYARSAQSLGQRLAFDIRTKLLERLPSKRASNSKLTPSELGSRFVNDVEQIQVKNVYSRVNLPFYIITAAVSIGLMLLTSPALTAMILLPSPLLFLISIRYGRRLERVQGRIAAQRAAAISGGTQIISSNRESGEGAVSESQAGRYRELASGLRDSVIKNIKLSAGYGFVFGQTSMLVTNYLVLLIGFLLFAWFGSPSVGMVTAFVGFAGQFKGAIEGLLWCYTSNRSAEGQTRKVLDILGAPSGPPRRGKAAMMPPGHPYPSRG